MSSPGLSQRLFPVLLLCAAGLLAWALWHEEPDNEIPFAEPGASEGAHAEEARTRRAAGQGTETNAPARSPSNERAGNDQGIPRLLPPDAAIEDVRDALAQPASERRPALQLAYRSIGQLAVRGAGVLHGLRRYLEAVDDPIVRGVSIAALGSERSHANLDWLAARLGAGPAAEDRLGALVALARDTAARTATTRMAAARTAKAPSLGGLTYSFRALPARADVRAGLAQFLDSKDLGAASDAQPILLWSLGRSAAEAALLVTKDGRACRLLEALPAEARASLAAAALRHRELPAQVRIVLEALPKR